MASPPSFLSLEEEGGILHTVEAHSERRRGDVVAAAAPDRIHKLGGKEEEKGERKSRVDKKEADKKLAGTISRSSVVFVGRRQFTPL